jgi:hypothetical protein
MYFETQSTPKKLDGYRNAIPAELICVLAIPIPETPEE